VIPVRVNGLARSSVVDTSRVRGGTVDTIDIEAVEVVSGFDGCSKCRRSSKPCPQIYCQLVDRSGLTK